jgi:7-cyano-7-deazaguanine reductase
VKRETSGRNQKTTKLGYNERHAKSGIIAPLPEIETFPNQYKGYEITIEIPEYTAICPKTNLPDFGTITLHYMPDKACLELKSLKMYIYAYRNLGIFYENAVNRILHDVVKASRPVWAKVTGIFTARGGLSSRIEAKFP